jgi:hypothetical protein
MPNLLWFGVCDDVRSEQGNKVTLVGYYGQSVNVGVLPAVLPKLCFFAEFDLLEGATVFAVRIIGPSGQMLLEMQNMSVSGPQAVAEMVPAAYRRRVIVFQIAPMVLNESGEYRIEYDFQVWPIFRTGFFIGLDPSLLQARSAT